MITNLTVEHAGRVFVDPAAYADEPRFHAACAVLRRDDPVHRVEVEGFNPFYAITKHADVMEIERQQDKWLNAPSIGWPSSAGSATSSPMSPCTTRCT